MKSSNCESKDSTGEHACARMRADVGNQRQLATHLRSDPTTKGRKGWRDGKCLTFWVEHAPREKCYPVEAHKATEAESRCKADRTTLRHRHNPLQLNSTNADSKANLKYHETAEAGLMQCILCGDGRGLKGPVTQSFTNGCSGSAGSDMGKKMMNDECVQDGSSGSRGGCRAARHTSGAARQIAGQACPLRQSEELPICCI